MTSTEMYWKTSVFAATPDPVWTPANCDWPMPLRSSIVEKMNIANLPNELISEKPDGVVQTAAECSASTLQPPAAVSLLIPDCPLRLPHMITSSFILLTSWTTSSITSQGKVLVMQSSVNQGQRSPIYNPQRSSSASTWRLLLVSVTSKLLSITGRSVVTH